MTMNDQDTFQALVTRRDLGEVLRGRRPANTVPMLERGTLPRLSSRDALAVWTGQSLRPCAIFVADEDRQELFAWLYSFQRDLAPITSWCHVLPASEIGRLGPRGFREADLVGFEAAWSGAIIAEAMILSGRGFEEISLASCLATETYAIARTAALYGAKAALSESLDQLEATRTRIQRSADKNTKLATRLVIEVLLRLLPDAPPPANGMIGLLVEACKGLNSRTGSSGDSPEISPRILQQIATRFPELSALASMNALSAEDRVRLLRQMRGLAATADVEQRQILLFTAGYVISRIGGAERDLRLAETFASARYDVLTWATILGGLGAEAYWTDAFHGIGRLVSRELLRPFRFSDSPTCDISIDELLVLESDEFSTRVKFRTASRNAVMLALRAGVVVHALPPEDERGRQKAPETRASTASTISANLRVGDDARSLHMLAEQLMPFLSPLIRAEVAKLKERRPTKKSPPTLPLDE